MIESLRLPASPAERTLAEGSNERWMMVAAPTVWWPAAVASESIGQELEPHLALTSPMVVELVKTDSEYVASEPQTGMYGEGDTDLEAISSLLRSLAALRTELRGHGERLAPELAADLRFLDNILWR